MTIGLGDTVVVIPAYNSEAFIAEAVKSALDQHPEVRVLVSDNASTDATVQRVKELRSDRVTVHRQKRNIGPQENHNWLLDNCVGDIISFLCSDDVMLPGHLDRQVKILAADDSVKLVGCNMRVTTADLTLGPIRRTARGRWQGSELTALSINTLRNMFGGPSNYVFRRRDVRETRFDGSLPWLSDFDFASRIAGEGLFVNHGQVGYLYRRHPATDSARLTAADAESKDQEWSEYFLTHGGKSPRAIKALRAALQNGSDQRRLDAEWERRTATQRIFGGPVFLNRVIGKAATTRAGGYFMPGHTQQ